MVCCCCWLSAVHCLFGVALIGAVVVGLAASAAYSLPYSNCYNNFVGLSGFLEWQKLKSRKLPQKPGAAT